MKTKLFYLLAFAVVFSGCSKIQDLTTKSVSTQLKADIPVVVVAKKSVGEVSASTFTKTQDLTLSSNTDIEPLLKKIKTVELNSLVVTVNGLTANQTITSVSLDVTGVGNVFTKTNITMTSNSFTPVIAAGTLDNVAAKLTSDKKITLTVSGTASGPMTFTVNLNFGTVITASLF
jgi:hypothetical protein